MRSATDRARVAGACFLVATLLFGYSSLVIFRIFGLRRPERRVRDSGSAKDFELCAGTTPSYRMYLTVAHFGIEHSSSTHTKRS
jgi:hypothetical protein